MSAYRCTAFLLLFISGYYCQYVINGRTQQKDQLVEFDWSNVQITTEFIGDKIEILLEDPGNLYNIILDGYQTSVLQADPSKSSYTINAGNNGHHQLMITKRTEASEGIAKFKGFRVPNGELVAIVPTDAPNRSIELIGDSLSCGYGNVGTFPCHWSPQTEDAYQTYGQFIATRFNAELHLECWSGKGVVRNYGSPNTTSPDPFPIYYPRSLANDASLPWNFTQWIPDAVLINLGTNDYSTAPQPPENIFITGYLNLISKVQKSYTPFNPNLQTFVICGPVIGNPCCSYVEKVSKMVNNVHYINIQNILKYPDDFGCDGHPNVSGHEKMATAVIPTVQKVMNW